jgi:hypothetical protein
MDLGAGRTADNSEDTALFIATDGKSAPGSLNDQVLRDRQLTAGQRDGLADERRGEGDGVAALRGGDLRPERTDTAVGGIADDERVEQATVFQGLQQKLLASCASLHCRIVFLCALVCDTTNDGHRVG